MKTLIVYFSRTGTTAKLAQALAQELEAEMVEIDCPKYAPEKGGWFRYLLAGYDSLKGRLPQIKGPDVDMAGYDLLLLGTPIWTSYPSAPMRAFLARHANYPARVALFVTSGGHSPAEKATDMVSGLLPAPVEATLAIGESKMKADEYLEDVKAFTDRLKRPDTKAGKVTSLRRKEHLRDGLG